MELQTHTRTTDEEINPLFKELRKALVEYIDSRERITLNGLSRKCQVSEPTLRRIYKGQIKTLPNITTILDILSTITGKTSTIDIAKQFPGPIADFLHKMVPQAEDCQTGYSAELNKEFKNPIHYILYKLSANSCGLTIAKTQELFGIQGLKALEYLLEKNYLKKKENHYFSNMRNFTTSRGDFVRNIRVIADFIKLRFSVTQPLLNPVLANYSESISIEAYKEIAQIQNKALEKIRKIMSDDKNSGPIPLFLFTAIDTMDARTAFEIAEQN